MKVRESDDMAFCINCGQGLVEGANFCANCGKAVNRENFTTQRKTVYEGQIHKCPNCGETINSFVSNCPTCGYEMRDSHGVSSIRQLAMKLEQLEATRSPQKNMNIFEQAFYGGTQLQKTDEQKIELIRNFAIPNTKEDILEFIIFAAANIDLKVYGLESNSDPTRRELSDAWLSKLEQADQKAEILFGHTQDYLTIRNTYERKLKAINKQKRQIMWLVLGASGAIICCILLLMLLGLSLS